MVMSMNRVQLIGHVGRDPVVKEFSGSKVAHFSLATQDKWKGGKSGKGGERTEWHRVTCWNYQAEIVAESVRKGTAVFVDGSIQYRSFEGSDGKVEHITEIRAMIVQPIMPTPKQEYGGEDGGRQSGVPSAPDTRQTEDYDDFPAERGSDDEIPF